MASIDIIRYATEIGKHHLSLCNPKIQIFRDTQILLKLGIPVIFDLENQHLAVALTSNNLSIL